MALADGTLVLIVEIEVGDVVSCLEEEALSSVDGALASPFPDYYEQVDPATWRAVRLRFDDHAEVPTIVELLRPAAWLTCSGVALGALVPLHIDELHISGPARVEAIRSCPEITDPQGPGRRVVTATSRRFTPETLTLSPQEVAPGDATCPKWSTGTSACISTTTGATGTTTIGWVSTLNTTANHQIWSLDRATWIAAGDLQAGEFVRSGTGATVVLSSRACGPAEVLNLEVHRSHALEVGESRVVVHNSQPAARTTAATRAAEVQGALGARTQRAVTTAVTETREDVRIVTSSEGRLRPAQRAVLQPGEVAGVGQRGVHAEVNGINAARDMGLTPTGVAPSRPLVRNAQRR